MLKKFRKKIIKLFLGLIVLFTVFIIVGSILIKDEVIKALNRQAAETSSSVYTRPYPIIKNTPINIARFAEKLKRLGYQEVDHLPTFAGQYNIPGQNLFDIYLKGSILPDGSKQESELVRLKLAEKNSSTLNQKATNKVTPINQKNIKPQFIVESIELVNLQHQKDSIYIEPELLGYLGENETRATSPRTLKNFPDNLKNAILSIEDERFYIHFGIDPIGILRAALVNFKAKRIVQGASTLTQQLAKNLFLTSKRDYKRKLQEVFAAILIEASFSKDQILEFYMNEVFLGQEGNVAIHGFGEAAKSFYGKDVEKLTLAESATLAGLISAPTKLSPRKNPNGARDRRNTVLAKMKSLGRITEEDYELAIKEEIVAKPPTKNKRNAPYFVDYIKNNLQSYVDLSSAKSNIQELKLSIFTGIDNDYQKCAEQAVTQGMERLEKAYKKLQKKKPEVAIVSLLTESNEVIAWVGGRDYSKNQFDRVSLAKRQPGSAFKPFVYLTALDKSLNNYKPARTTTLLADEPRSFEIVGAPTWYPKNYDDKYRGDVTLREALIHSLNLPTINLAEKVGIDSIVKTAELFGFGKNLPKVLSLSLGAGEVTPFEMARAYSGLANGGQIGSPLPIISIFSAVNNNLIFKKDQTKVQVASEQAVFVLTDILQGVILSGTGNIIRQLGFTRDAAGKTGTTNDARDAWFVGYTPHLLAAVWVGYDDNSVLGLTGGQAAAPIWSFYMQCVSDLEPDLKFIPPEGVVYEQIDKYSGLIASEECGLDNAVTEIFVDGNQPVTTCSGDNTPPEEVAPEGSLNNSGEDSSIFSFD